MVPRHTGDSLPLVSVLVLNYNQARFVVECLESVRAQTYASLQLIIMDDCSADGSVDIIREWIAKTGTTCTFIAHAENRGVCRTLNEALSFASGKYVAMIAADDIWLPAMIEEHVRVLERADDEVGIVYGDSLQIDEDGNLLPQKFIESHRAFSRMPEGDIFSVLVQRSFIPAHTALIRRSCYDRVGLYDESLCIEDWDMWLRIGQYFKFAFSKTVNAKYRIVATSITRQVLTKETYETLASYFRIHAKCLASGRLSPDLRQTVMQRLCGNAERMYKRGHKDRHRFLWEALRTARTTRMALMFAMSSLRIPHAVFRAIDAAHTRWKQKDMIPAAES